MPPQSFPECLLFCWLSCVCVCACVNRVIHQMTTNNCACHSPRIQQMHAHTLKKPHMHAHAKCCHDNKGLTGLAVFGVAEPHSAGGRFLLAMTENQNQKICFQIRTWQNVCSKKQQQKKKNMTEMFLYASWWQKESIEFSIVWIQLGGSNVHVLTFAVWYFFSIWIVVLRCGSPLPSGQMKAQEGSGL